jgi:hypothetical protein
MRKDKEPMRKDKKNIPGVWRTRLVQTGATEVNTSNAGTYGCGES